MRGHARFVFSSSVLLSAVRVAWETCVRDFALPLTLDLWYWMMRRNVVCKLSYLFYTVTSVRSITTPLPPPHALSARVDFVPVGHRSSHRNDHRSACSLAWLLAPSARSLVGLRETSTTAITIFERLIPPWTFNHHGACFSGFELNSMIWLDE